MSLPNIFGNLGNIFGGIFQSASSSFSGIVNFGSNISNGFANVVNALKYGLNEFVNVLQSIPSDITNFFSQVGTAILIALHSIGGFLYAGLHDIASAFIGGFDTIRKAFMAFGENVVNFFDALRNDIVNIALSVAQLFSPIADFFVSVWNDIKSIAGWIFNAIVQIWNGIVNFGNSVINFLLSIPNVINNILTLPQQLSDIPSLVPGLIKQEATRIGNAFPRILGYNLAMEALKHAIKKGNLSLKDIMLVPATAILMGLLSEPIFSVAYSDTTYSGVATYNTQKSVPPNELPTVSPTSHQPLQSYTPSQTESISSSSTFNLPPAPTQFGFRHPSVTGFTVVDELSIGSGNMLSNVGGFNITQQIQSLTDSFSVSAELLSAIIRALEVSAFDAIVPIIETKTYLAGYKPLDTLGIEYEVEVATLQLPSYLTICTYGSPMQPLVGNVQGTSVSETLSVIEMVCVPVQYIAIDEFTFITATNLINTSNPNASDQFTFTVTGQQLWTVNSFSASLSMSITENGWVS